jgi:ribose transport system permease protein
MSEAGPQLSSPSPAGPSAAPPGEGPTGIAATFSLVTFLLERFGVIIAFVVLFGWNALLAENAATFRSPENLRNMLNQNAATGIVAVGMTLVIVIGGIDLSVGSIMALAGAAGLLLMNSLLESGLSEWAAVVTAGGLAIGIGAACGALNGLLITIGRLPAFIATLGGLSAFRSITLAYANGGEVRADRTEVLTLIGRGGVPILPGKWLESGVPLLLYWNVILFLVIAVVGEVVLSRTRFGRHLVAVGGNELAARYSAISVGRVRFVAYLISGVLSAIAGLMLTARSSSMSSSQLGSLMELDAIAAVVIGGTSMAGGRGRIWGTVLGVLILAIISNMMVVANISIYWQGCVKGGIIVLAVLIQRGRR